MTTTPPRRFRSKAVGLGLTVMMAANLSGCGQQKPDYAGICVDPQTHQRVSDSKCPPGQHPNDYNGGGITGSEWFWFYMATSSNHSVPAIGGTYDDGWGTYNGTRVSKSYSVQRGGMPRSGGSFAKVTKSGSFSKSSGVSRSGFSKSGGFGSSHSSSSS